MDQKLLETEDFLTSSFKEKLKAVEEMLSTRARESGGSSAWRIAFFLLFLVLIGGGVGAYLFYQRLRKIHML